MQFFIFGLKIPTGKRSVVINAPLKCESLGIMINDEMVKGYDVKGRLNLYANLIHSLAHLYQSANVMNNALVENLKSIHSAIEEQGALLELRTGWSKKMVSASDELELEFFINEVDQYGVPLDADDPDGYLVARYSIDDFDMVPVAVELKKHMTTQSRAVAYEQLFGLLREHSPEKEERNAWFKQLEGIFKNDEHPIVKNTYWARSFSSGELSIEVTFRPLEDLADLCEFEGTCGLNIMKDGEKSFLRVEELPDA